MVYAQTRICLGDLDAQTSLGFWDTNPSLTIRPSDSRQKKKKKKKKKNVEPGRIVDFAFPADHRVKIKEN